MPIPCTLSPLSFSGRIPEDIDDEQRQDYEKYACHESPSLVYLPPGRGMLSGRLSAGRLGFLMKAMKLMNATAPRSREKSLYPLLAHRMARTASPIARIKNSN